MLSTPENNGPRIKVKELFHGFAFSESTGHMEVQLLPLGSINILEKKFPEQCRTIPAKTELWINAAQAAYADAMVLNILLQFKKNELHSHDTTISRWSVALEANKAGFKLSPEMQQHSTTIRTFNKLRFEQQRVATESSGFDLFVFMTDKRIPDLEKSILDGPFVLMDASNTYQVIPPLVKLGFLYGL